MRFLALFMLLTSFYAHAEAIDSPYSTQKIQNMNIQELSETMEQLQLYQETATCQNWRAAEQVCATAGNIDRCLKIKLGYSNDFFNKVAKACKE